MSLEYLLDVKDLRTSFFTHVGEIKAIRGVDFSMEKGEIIGIVGESGSGKSVTSLSIMQLLQYPGKVIHGEIYFKGKNILNCSKQEMRKIRGNEISMIFQDPMTSLNPLYTVGKQIVENISEHTELNKAEARERAIEMLRIVGIPSPEERYCNYPHEFSGGMRQRAMIAMALSCNPSLLIADEPTTALDVTIQIQILNLIKQLNQKLGMSTILITHDLGVVANMCRKILVMYAGVVLEEGSVHDIFYRPKHPYTMGLLKSIPKASGSQKEKLLPIPGSPPDLLKPPPGCPFCNRCEFARNLCVQEMPPYFRQEQHRAMCWLLHEDAPRIERYERLKGGVGNGKAVG